MLSLEFESADWRRIAHALFFYSEQFGSKVGWGTSYADAFERREMVRLKSAIEEALLAPQPQEPEARMDRE